MAVCCSSRLLHAANTPAAKFWLQFYVTDSNVLWCQSARHCKMADVDVIYYSFRRGPVSSQQKWDHWIGLPTFCCSQSVYKSSCDCPSSSTPFTYSQFPFPHTTLFFPYPAFPSISNHSSPVPPSLVLVVLKSMNSANYRQNTVKVRLSICSHCCSKFLLLISCTHRMHFLVWLPTPFFSLTLNGNPGHLESWARSRRDAEQRVKNPGHPGTNNDDDDFGRWQLYIIFSYMAYVQYILASKSPTRTHVVFIRIRR